MLQQAALQMVVRHWGYPSGDLVWSGLPPTGLGPSPQLGRGRTPEAVELALHKIRDSLEGQSTTGTVGWMFLIALDRVTMGREMRFCVKGQNGNATVGCYEEGKKVIRA